MNRVEDVGSSFLDGDGFGASSRVGSWSARDMGHGASAWSFMAYLFMSCWRFVSRIRGAFASSGLYVLFAMYAAG